MAAGKGTLTVRVVGDSKPFEKTMGKIGGVAKRSFQAIGIAAAAGAAKGLTSFVGFERQMNEVFTLLPGISDKAMGEMTDQVKNFSKEFGVLPDEVVPALYQSLSAGVPKDNVFEFLETAQKAAKGGVTDLTTAVDGISSVVNAYGSDVLNATQASDLMFTAVRLGKTNFEQLSASLSNVTPIASGLGVSFEDVAAGLAALTAKGTPTAQATTQMRAMFVELSKAGSTTAGVFEEMAGKTFQEFIAAGGDTSEALAIMQQAADESGVQLQDLFSSVEAGSAALALAGGDDTFARNIEEMGNAAGATEDAFDRMMTGLGPIFDRVKAGLAVFLIEVGERLAPLVETAMERVGVAFAIVSDWWAEHGPAIIARVTEVKDAIMGWIDEVKPHIQSWIDDNLENIRKWWEDHGPTVIGLIEDLRDAMVDAGEKIVEAVQHVVDEWDKYKVAVGVAVAIMIPHFVALGAAAVASAVTQVGAWLLAKAAAVGAAVVHSVQIAAMIAGWVGLAAVAVAKAVIIAGAWLIALGPIGLLAIGVVAAVVLIALNWDKLKRKAEEVRDWVIDRFEDVVEFFVELPGKIATAVAGLAGKMKEIGEDMMDGLTEGIGSKAGGVADAVGGVIGGGIDLGKSILGISSPSKLFYGFGEDTIRGYIDGLEDQEISLVTAITDIFQNAVNGVNTILGSIGAKTGRTDAAKAVVDAEAELERVRSRASALPDEIAAAERRLAVARSLANRVTLDEETAILRAVERLARAKEAVSAAEAEGVASATEMRLLQLDVLKAQEDLSKARADSIAPTQDVVDAEEELAELREEQTDLIDDEWKAVRRLENANLQLVRAQLSLVGSGNELLEVGTGSAEMFEKIALEAGLSADAVYNLRREVDLLANHMLTDRSISLGAVMPAFHAGGTFNAPRPGGQGLARLRDGEHIVTPTEPAAASPYLRIHPDDLRTLASELRRMERAS